MTFQSPYSDNFWWYPPYPYYPSPQPYPYSVGWSCPRCGRVWSPSVTSCDCSHTTTPYWYTSDSGTASNNITFTVSGDFSNMAETISDAMDIRRKMEGTDDDDDGGPTGVPA